MNPRFSSYQSAMSYRNQNKPPRTPFSFSDSYPKKDANDEIVVEKRRRILSGKMSTPIQPTGRGLQPFAAVINSQYGSVNGDSARVHVPQCSVSEFTPEEVEDLLNMKIKAKKFDIKGKMEQILEHNKKLKLCINWFQEQGKEQTCNFEKLQNEFDISKKGWNDIEMEMKQKNDELNQLVLELRRTNTFLEEKCTNEESEKMDALECHRREKEARETAEMSMASLQDEIAKVQHDKLAACEQVSSINDMYKILQEYNTSLQQYNSKLQSDLANTNESLKRVEEEKMAIVENLRSLRGHYNLLQDQLTSCRVSGVEVMKEKDTLNNEVNCLRGELQQVRGDRDHQTQQVQILKEEVGKYIDSTGRSSIKLNNLETKCFTLEETCTSQRDQLQILEYQLDAAREKLKMEDLSASEARTRLEEQKIITKELQDHLGDAELRIIEGEEMRKKLHNTILELKGNIRVFCRVRPLLSDDFAGNDGALFSYPTSADAIGRGIDLIQTGQNHSFSFDKVFSHEASQQDVFVEISQLVQSALDGYKVCIFAYGQTGSGKTYTMMGAPEIPSQKGLIPRSLEQIFETSQSLSNQGWKYKMQASMLEIYNESIHDLLSINRYENVTGKQYAIKHDANGNTQVSDLTIVDVCSISEISALLHQAAESRAVGKTQMNEQSSRSHLVFTLRIFGTNESTEQQVQGVLNLIDLAGSERLSKSGATGDRLKETQAINKSLSSLADVVFSLAKKEDHVPFRNSKLTYLLQPCLGGDSKTLMFVNISPDLSSVGESLCSLRFAARVNSCEIGIPRRHTGAAAGAGGNKAVFSDIRPN